MAPPIKSLVLLTVLMVGCFVCHALSVADEIVIERNSTRDVGDFKCTNCPDPTASKFELNNGEITAGQLWQEFNRQGMNRVEQLTFLVSLEQLGDAEGFELRPVQFKLDDYTASFKGNSLFVPVDDSGSSTQMAKLELNLPFDFMERYSADSQEPIKVTSANGDEAIVPGVSMQIDSGIKSSHLALVGFAAFWIVVFVLFNRLTKPTAAKSENSGSLQTPPNRQALSA
jgi:hypothetical protein